MRLQRGLEHSADACAAQSFHPRLGPIAAGILDDEAQRLDDLRDIVLKAIRESTP
ncbi:hypothetical protein M446_1180 [Methylobacterium sp. 4-46]|nr:hypothetical protein M446_1180 [Methylobacterium sp. 4-46]